jgi:hypothetical protein
VTQNFQKLKLIECFLKFLEITWKSLRNKRTAAHSLRTPEFNREQQKTKRIFKSFPFVEREISQKFDRKSKSKEQLDDESEITEKKMCDSFWGVAQKIIEASLLFRLHKLTSIFSLIQVLK